MRINFGKYKGKSVEFLVLKEPDYVKWILDSNDITGPLLLVKKEILRLINVFDRKPFLRKCTGCKEKVAIRASLCDDNPIPWWWCNDCEPDLSEILKGRIHIVITYTQALDHIRNYCGGRKGDLNYLIHLLAEAKGLQKRVGEKQAHGFFL